MNFVFLSPHFPPNFYRFCVALQKLGVNVLGIGDCGFGELRPELRAALGWYYQVSDLHNCGELSAACSFFAGKFGRLDGLDSLTEYWLETESRLRAEFDIPGIKPDTIALIRRKSDMKKIFARANVPAARGVLLRDAAQARAFAGSVGFPVIIKPDSGVGAANTHRISAHAELDAFLAHNRIGDFIMEEFVHGDIVSFDGIADWKGEIVFCTSHSFFPPPLEALVRDGDMYYYSAREIAPDIEQCGRKLAAEFGVRGRFFHFEFFRGLNGELTACEVNMRPPGGMTMDMFNFACDADLYAVWARIMAGKNGGFEYSRKYHCGYIGRKDSRNYLRSHEEVLRGLAGLLVYHGPLPQVFSRGMGNYGYLVRAENLEPVLAAVDFVQKTV